MSPGTLTYLEEIPVGAFFLNEQDAKLYKKEPATPVRKSKKLFTCQAVEVMSNGKPFPNAKRKLMRSSTPVIFIIHPIGSL